MLPWISHPIFPDLGIGETLALFIAIAVSFQNTVPYFLILSTCMVITTPESVGKLVRRVGNQAPGMQCF